MASSDDEGETVPQSVANYDFVDEKDEPVSFAALPIKWSELESPDGMTTQMFLHGTADSGLQKVYKQVSAWKFELSCEQPEISVLSKENKWIKLQKPRKSFEETIRTILITLHCLHFAKKNTETSAKSLWDHLLKVFSLYEVPPSENDLLNHWRLMSEAVKRDETLSKCKFLTTFVEEKPRKRKPFDEVFQAPKKKFIVDDDDEDESDEEGDLFDSVCAICDNGGELLCCEGRCMRSFHATVDAGSESLCKSLGFSDDQVEAIQNFLCLNCQYKQHQCFACGTLGSSDKSLTAEVFPCVSATCGHFYHPECAAKLLHPGNETAAEELEKKIAAGQPFICPVHKCLVCKQGENKKVHELQFAVCRRCPKAYHRKCLPRKIAFEDSEDGDIIQRAWEGLMPNRILIYCLKHKIEDDIGTPVRNHIKFPEDKQKREKCPTALQRNKEKALAKKRRTVSEDSYGEKTAVKAPELVPKVSSAGKDSGSTKKISRTGSDSFTKSTILDSSGKSSKGNSKPTLMRDKSFTPDERKVSLGEDELNSQSTKGLDPQFKPKQLETSGSKLGKKKTAKPVTKKLGSSHTLLDADAEKRIMDLMKDVSSSITLDKILQNHELPSTHAYSWKHMVDKTITLGKVEVSVEAVRTALQKLEEGCSIDDARDVCEPEILKQIIKWKNKLKVYLAPFLYGLRYTSYGRHFTKVGKLKEIVDWLHWYVQNGDTIVDFCCGANDFSCLMKKKLEETGKKCAFKNYDLIQPKNDFNFEKRDWMSVHPRELPTGSQLIMGLNPPFGVKASLANKFINKALEFKPKLIILIVPKETERLDKKEAAYDLIWEDGQKLSGKSFYLPGSVDVNDKQMEQWNQKPPPLYLWSRPDWTTKHKAIAQKHGHMVTKEELHADENRHDTKVSENPKEADDDYCADISKLINDYGDDSRSLDYLPEQIGETEKSEEARAAGSKEKKKGLHSNIGNKGGKNHDQGNKRSREDSVDWGDKHKHARGKAEALAANKQDGDRSPQVSERYKEIPPTISSPNRRSLLSHSLEELETPPERSFREGNYSQFHPSGAGMGSNGHGGIQTSSPEEIARRYGGIQNSISEDIVRRYSRNSEDPLPSGTNNWSTGLRHGYEYGLRSFDEPNPSYLRDNADVFGRTSYGGELDEKYGGELDEKYRREADIRAQLRLYGRQEADPLSQRSSTYLTSQGSGFGHMGSLSATAYSRIGSASESSSYDRMGLSAMQRYAPQLDELNRGRMSNLGSGISPVGRSGGIYDRSGSVPGLLANSMGFAPGPQRPFSDHNSSGWLND